MTVYNIKEKNHLQKKMFFDDSLGIQRYETVKYKQFDKLTNKQLGYFWRPEEVDLTKDINDFKKLNNYEQHIFTSNLKRQILLDSVQGRSPSLAFLPICTLPELEAWINTWSFVETIHSRSYSHIIRAIYSDPSKTFDEINDIKEILDCAKIITKYYDNLIKNPTKENLYLAIMSVNILEGIQFYVSFICSWAFVENRKMEGNGKIIKLICRDENLHLASTQYMLKLLPGDDKDFIKIIKDKEEECREMFKTIIDLEKSWSSYLFKDGSLLGLNHEILCDYIDYISYKRMSAVKLEPFVKQTNNPIPWSDIYIGGNGISTSPIPQETEITSYITGDIKKNLNIDDLKHNYDI